MIGKVILLLVLMILEVTSSVLMQTWSPLPQQPFNDNSISQEDTPTVDPNKDCTCPPNTKCTLDYKIRRDMVDFMHIQGIINDEEADLQRKEIKISENNSNKVKFRNARLRDRMDSDSGIWYPKNECCCPPQSILSPTFITRKRFVEALHRMMNDNKNKNNQKNMLIDKESKKL